ncbi:WD40-repeat containing protein [Gracilaria domingensis]|nr:WD40-repeat containing protein [Gracilaria domingensis]
MDETEKILGGVGKTSGDSGESELPHLDEADAEEIIVLESQGNTAQDHDAEENEEDNDEEDNDEGSIEDVTNLDESVVQDDAVIVLREHESETLAVAASPTNRNIVISGGMDDIGIIWDIELQSVIAKVDGAKESVSTVAFSNDGKYAAFGSENGAISIVFMDGSTPEPNLLEGPSDAINFFSWHPKGPVLLAGSSDTVAYMWNVVKGKFMTAFAGHEDAITCGSFTSDGKLVVTASRDSSVRVWSPTGGNTILRIQTGMASLRASFHTADIYCMGVGTAESKAALLLASGCAAGDVFITHRETGQIVAQLPRHDNGVESISFAPQGFQLVLLATAGADGVVRVWDVENSIERCKFFHGGVVSRVVWHPSRPFIASGSSEGTIVVWNVLEGKEVRKFGGHTAFISDLCFAGDNNFIASTSGDGTVRLFDLRKELSKV